MKSGLQRAPTSIQKLTLRLLTLPEKPQIMDVSNFRPKRTSAPSKTKETKNQGKHNKIKIKKRVRTKIIIN